MLGLAGELIVVDGKVYVKTSFTGPLYVETDVERVPRSTRRRRGGMIDNLGDILLKPGVTLVKGDDVACGSKQCYTVTADLTPPQLGPTALGPIAGAADRPDRGDGQADAPRREGPAEPPGRRHGRRHDARRDGSLDGRPDRLEVGRAGHDHGPAGRPGQAAS